MKIKKILMFSLLSIFFFCSYEVNAAEEFSYTNANWAFHECNWNGTETSNCKWTSTAAIGTNIYRDTDFYIDGFRINLNYSGTTLVAGNSYTLTFNMAVSTPYYFATLTSPLAFVETRESCIGATSSATDCLYENFSSFSIKPSYSGSGNVVKFTINFVPSQNSNYVKIFLIQTNNTYNMLQLNDIDLIEETNYGRIGSINGTYVSGTSAIIENQTNVIQNQTDTIINQNTQINDNIINIQDSINDTNVSESENVFGQFFNGFTTNTHGLTGIITAPLQLIGSITSSSCSDLILPLPYVNENLTLPCMSSIYYNYFGNFFTIYQTITFGIISYWVIIRIFNLVKDFKNPEHDEIEVMDL